MSDNVVYASPPLTAHALARMLLAGPDLPVATGDREFGTYHGITRIELEVYTAADDAYDGPLAPPQPGVPFPYYPWVTDTLLAPTFLCLV